MTKKIIVENIQAYLVITFGLFIDAFGWAAFLIPHQIVGGGVSGVGMLLYSVTGIPVGVMFLIINAVLVLIAMRLLGAHFGIKTIYGILAISFFLTVLQQLIKEPLVKDPVMATLVGGILGGVGVGLAFTKGGNSGGTDIIAMIINKYRNVSPGRVILTIDIFIIGSSYLFYHSPEKIVYGYVVMAVFSYAIDLVLTGSKQSFQIMVFSEKYQKIADRVISETQRGVSAVKGRGWYNKKETEVLIIIATKYDKSYILKIINQEDQTAFISIAKVQGVFGQNFDTIRL